MCVVANYFTPQRLFDQMAQVKSWGISRLHWIDYSDWPSFWQIDLWKKNGQKTVEACGDFLRCAVQQAHANELELIVDFKVFDLGFNSLKTDDEHGAVMDFENRYCAVIPEIAAHPHATMQSHANWRTETALPATKLRFYSDEPLREIPAAEIELLVSQDNRNYETYSGPFEIRQGEVERANQRWTPAGLETDNGTTRNWFLELSNLELSAPFAALKIGGEKVEFSQRGFWLLEIENRDGQDVAAVVATAATLDEPTKYSFWKQWPGWANITEPLLQRRRFDGRNLGFSLRAMHQMPTLLEPTHPQTHEIWLHRIERLLESGADGVSLRILCHHTGVMNYLQHAFAPVVVEKFRQQWGREPAATPNDYEQIRRLRGAAFTDFVRAARQLANERGKKLMVELESGMEVGPQFDTRMQIFWDWKTWLEEELFDEISLKFWTPYSRFVHQQIMPIARQKNLPVHVITRNLNGVMDERSLETLPRLARDARELGFAGLNFYEAANLIEMNPEGVSFAKGMAVEVMKRIRQGNN